MNSISVIIYIIVHTYHMKIRKFVKANYFTIFSIGRIVYVHFSKTGPGRPLVLRNESNTQHILQDGMNISDSCIENTNTL